MPHKHTRRKGGDETNFNLAPSTTAKPLPTYSNRSKIQKKQSKAPKHTKANDNNTYKHDDTPRAFMRMMQHQTLRKRPRSDLDDGDLSRKSTSHKKRKADDSSGRTPGTQNAQFGATSQPEIPRILPGERLGDFAARVDQALPITGLKRKGNIKIDGVKMQERQTKKEKSMQKMYAAWRDEDARIKEKLAEQQELAEDAEAEAEMEGRSVSFPLSKKKRTRGGAVEDEDPWAELKERREERKGLHDVVQAPPSFKAIPKERFKVKGGAKVEVENVPSAAGSLKRREELGRARSKVIEGYRSIMGRVG